MNNRISFGAWLTAQQHRIDNTGALARDFAADKNWSFQSLYERLLTGGAEDSDVTVCNSDFADLDAARREYDEVILLRKEWGKVVSPALLCTACGGDNEIVSFQLLKENKGISRIALCAPCAAKQAQPVTAKSSLKRSV